jgi:hypothetical protein
VPTPRTCYPPLPRRFPRNHVTEVTAGFHSKQLLYHERAGRDAHPDRDSHENPNLRTARRGVAIEIRPYVEAGTGHGASPRRFPRNHVTEVTAGLHSKQLL